MIYQIPSFLFSYSKAEDLDFSELREFTFLVVASSDYKHHQNTHKVIAKIQGYSKLKMNWKHWNMVQMMIELKIWNDMVQLIIEDKIYVLQQRIVSCAY